MGVMMETEKTQPVGAYSCDFDVLRRRLAYFVR